MSQAHLAVLPLHRPPRGLTMDRCPSTDFQSDRGVARPSRGAAADRHGVRARTVSAPRTRPLEPARSRGPSRRRTDRRAAARRRRGGAPRRPTANSRSPCPTATASSRFRTFLQAGTGSAPRSTGFRRSKCPPPVAAGATVTLDPRSADRPHRARRCRRADGRVHIGLARDDRNRRQQGSPAPGARRRHPDSRSPDAGRHRAERREQHRRRAAEPDQPADRRGDAGRSGHQPVARHAAVRRHRLGVGHVEPVRSGVRQVFVRPRHDPDAARRRRLEGPRQQPRAEPAGEAVHGLRRERRSSPGSRASSSGARSSRIASSWSRRRSTTTRPPTSTAVPKTNCARRTGSAR